MRLLSRWRGSGALLTASLLTSTFMGVLAGAAETTVPPLRGVAVEETLDGEAVLADALNEALLRASGLPLVARIVLARAELEPTPGVFRFERLDERIERYKTKGVPVLLAVRGPLSSPEEAPRWRSFVRALAERYRGSVRGYELGEIPEGEPPPPAKDFAFLIKLAAVELRTVDKDAVLFLAGPRRIDLAWQASMFSEDIAAYVDALALPVGPLGLADALARTDALLEREDPTATIMVTGVALEADPAAAARRVLADQLRHVGTRSALVSYTGGVRAVAEALRAVDQVKDVLTGEVVRLEDAAARLKLVADGKEVTSTFPHVLLYNLGNFSTYLAYDAAPGEAGPLAVELGDPIGRKPLLRDAISAKSAPLPGFVWDRQAGLTRVSSPLADRPLLVEFSYAEAAPAAHAEVSDRVLPPVGEIVFRHQQVQAAQDARLRSFLANAQIETHFRPNAADPGFDVVTENRFFSDKEGSEWEETSFTLNGSKWGRDRPPFPLLQPEKVLSLPLDLRLTRDYRYRLVGVESVEGRECYAVRFEPAAEGQSLYKGTVWLDTESFAKLKVQAVQTRLEAPVVSNEEIQFFNREATVDGVPVYLLSRFTSHQVMLVAGRNLLVERIVGFSDFIVNAPDFPDRRKAARAGDNIMYRDTDLGLRYLVKKGEERVVQDRPVTSAKALAFGVTFDPSYDYPLPIVGINYLDFEFLGKDSQLAVLFGGVLALANLQRPKAIGDKVDLSVDLFAIAVAVNDQVFATGGEVRGARLRNRPFSTGLNLGYQLTSFQKLLFNYQFRYDAYSTDAKTSPSFTPPVDTVTNGFGLGYEYRRGGYSLTLGGAYYRRASWEPWGDGLDYSPEQRSYQKWTASLSKDFFFNTVHKVHLNLAYFGGQHLDRFSSYQFGMFDDNKMRGVPSAGVRFLELAMFRGAYSFNLFEQYRLDLFVDQALGRGPGGDGLRESITGLGLGVNLKGPKGTMVRGEIGKSFLPERYRGSGTVVGQILVLKPF